MQLSNIEKLKFFAMKESGISFKDIAKQVGGLSAMDVAAAVVDVQIARSKYKEKVKVVYRRRLTTSSSHLKGLVQHMKRLK